MPISSSSIVHFTRNKTALKGILQNNFKVSYCTETLRADKRETMWAVPMVSFCDIPLSQVKEHIGKYGAYGIGLSKRWAKSQRLSPVQYIAAGSHYAESIKLSANSIAPRVRAKDPSEYTEQERAVLDVVRYSKNYEGVLKRDGRQEIANYRYYDEREWRYVPSSDADFPMIVPLDKKLTKSKKTALNNMASAHRLDFGPSDITYIIVKSDSEISEFVSAIRTAKGNNYTQVETERLTTRIITKEQIETDF